MQLLFENPTGLTTTEIVEDYFDDIDQKAVLMALKMLVYQNGEKRVKIAVLRKNGDMSTLFSRNPKSNFRFLLSPIID